MIRIPHRGLAAASCVLALAALACGCRDKKPLIIAPRPPAVPTLGKSWPNEDKRWWKYDLLAVSCSDTLHYYATIGEVPALPSMPALFALVSGLAPGAQGGRDSATYQLEFNASKFTGSGAYGQFLTESLFVSPAPFAIAGGPFSVLRAANASRGAPRAEPGMLLDEIARARPDLRARIAALSGRQPHAMAVGPSIPMFLHGGVWEKNTNAIGTFNDLDTVLRWIFLTSTLSTGSEFEEQVAPLLSPDIVLHGRILGQQSVTTPAGTYADALVCFYALDFGISDATDINGDPLGHFRSFDYGVVAYVQDVGPVYGYERHLVEMGAPLSHGSLEETSRLRATGLIVTQ
jgi:hypothetical protein